MFLLVTVDHSNCFYTTGLQSHIHTPMVQHQDRFWVQCLAQGHLGMLTAVSGIEPGTSRSLDDRGGEHFNSYWDLKTVSTFVQGALFEQRKMHFGVISENVCKILGFKNTACCTTYITCNGLAFESEGLKVDNGVINI